MRTKFPFKVHRVWAGDLRTSMVAQFLCEADARAFAKMDAGDIFFTGKHRDLNYWCVVSLGRETIATFGVMPLVVLKDAA